MDQDTAEEQKPAVCPVCLTVISSPPVRRYSVEEAARHFCPETRDAGRYARLEASLKKLWPQGECSVLVCTTCGFGFASPFVAGDEGFYALLHEQASYPAWRWEFAVALSLAQGERPRRALDVGAGDGAFLRHLKKNWDKCAVEGSELTRGPLRAQGYQVYANLDEAAQKHPGAFHLVTLFQVLEHLQDFAEVLRHCRRLLRPDGRLVISVPDGPMMLEQERVTGCPDMPPNHLAKWTPESLTRALQSAGLEVVQTVREKPSLTTFKYAVYLKLLAQTARPRSLVSQIYRLRSRALRGLALAFLALPAALVLASHPRYLLRGGSFTLVARPSV